MNALPSHSPVGASGAHRWMHCPGSVVLSQGIEDTESDFASLGTAGHALGADCLVHGYDAWEGVGQEFNKVVVDKEMADAVQVYLDAVRKRYPERNQGNTWIERPFHLPKLHPYFYGTADFVHWDEQWSTIHVWDYKHGAGIVVEAENNPQLMYYACGVIEELGLWGDALMVSLWIAQPRGFHWQGPVRRWDVETPVLERWLHETLVPAMDRAMVSTDLVSGDHCRFCPARSRACPALMADMDELERLMELTKTKGAAELTHEQVARYLDLTERAKIVAKAVSETAFARMSQGHAIPGWKLAQARANRVWKDDAESALKEKFGDEAFETKLKSPAQIEAMPEGKKLTDRYAFKPDAGLTVVRATDARASVSRDTKSMFKEATKRKGKK